VSDTWEFETKAIHAGQEPDKETGAVTVPIYATSTYAQTGVGKFPFSDYARVDNPTRSALQSALASLESAKHGFAFASGLAATDTLLRTLMPGDHLIMGLDAYGGTYRLITKILSNHGLEVSTVDLNDENALKAAFTEKTKFIWVETPSNPTLQIVDIAAISSFAHAREARVVVDNTFATPYLQNPLLLDADIIVHSTTKYIGGHSDVVGGFIAFNDDELAEEIKFLQYAVGAVPSPFDNYLLLRGIKTLPVRMDRHNENAMAISQFLSDHKKVDIVYYPGLLNHPNHDVAQKQMRGFGGMVSFIVSGGAKAARKVAESTKIFTLAESLGAVESLIEVPAAMTHASTAGSLLEVDPGLVRLSVGLENVEDLIADLTQAL
jgi:cystathionine gamma-synthase